MELSREKQGFLEINRIHSKITRFFRFQVLGICFGNFWSETQKAVI